MKRNRKSPFILLAVMLLALLSASLAIGLTPAYAQTNTADAACGSDANQAVDQPEANDVPDVPCETDTSQDSTACILIGAETTDDTQIDNHSDGEVNDDNIQGAPDAEVNDDNSQESPDAEVKDDNQADGETADDTAGNEVQDAAYAGSLKVDAAAYQNLPDAARCAALEKAAKITAEQAQAVVLKANPGSTVVKVELDIEDGYLIYDVELDNGNDIKVDAGDGSVLFVETSTDNQD